MPEPEPAATAAATKPEPADDLDNIPELIQDTQPALAILGDAPRPVKPAKKQPTHDTLPDIEALSAELAEPAKPEPKPETRTPAKGATSAPAQPAAAEAKPAARSEPAATSVSASREWR